MLSKERVKRTIHFERPDRLPIFYMFEEGFLQKHANELNKFMKNYPSDYSQNNLIDFQIPKKEEAYRRKYKDEWGCIWLDLLPGIAGEVKESPLQDWNQLKNFQVPTFPYEDKEGFKILKSMIEKEHARGLYVDFWGGSVRGGFNLFERMQWLRGVENFFVDLVENREKVEELADIITEEYLLKGARCLTKAGVDGFWLADDWGSQKSLLISPAMWREIFKPRYRRVIEFIHSQGVDVAFHSDGYIMQIIPDLIEIGVDVLNLQFSCMPLKELAKECKGKICILTDVDRQHLLPYGKLSEIKDYVGNMIETLATPEGGLILRGSVSSVDPLENVKAMYEAFWEYGNNYKQLARERRAEKCQNSK